MGEVVQQHIRKIMDRAECVPCLIGARRLSGLARHAVCPIIVSNRPRSGPFFVVLGFIFIKSLGFGKFFWDWNGSKTQALIRFLFGTPYQNVGF